MENVNSTEILSTPGPEQSHDEIMAYWTEEREANAIPMELPGRKEKPQCILSYGTAVKNRNDYPYNAIGKMYFTNNDKDYHCTAWVPAAVRNHGFVTAAHCVFSPTTKKWSTNIRVTLGYATVSCVSGFCDKRWVENTALSRDIATLKPAQHFVTSGGLMFMINRTITENQTRCNAIGYPDSPHQGSGIRLWENSTKVTKVLDGAWGDDSQILVKPEGLCSGASGGPWVISIGRQQFAVAVTSQLDRKHNQKGAYIASDFFPKLLREAGIVTA